MRFLYLITISLLCSLWSHAQQEEQFTQFMYTRMALNPAFAGSEEALTITALSRNQWLGLDGAPQTQLLSVVAPVLNQRIGIGGNIVRQSIGVTQLYTMDGAYAYRIKAPRGYLGIGLQASVRLLRVDFSQLRGTQPINQDEAVPEGIQSKFVPNFGAGLYYKARNFYLGFSVPRLLRTNIDLSDEGEVIAREVNHAYFMTGGSIELSEGIALQPQILLKYVTGAPFDADVNVNVVFGERFSTGISYRVGGSKQSGFGEAISLLLGVPLGEQVTLGFAYDATISDLRNYNSGTLEGLLRFRLKGKDDPEEVDNPRFF